MDVKFDFSDVDSFFEQGYAEVKAVEEKVGKEAVDYAVKNGNYQNRTGTLRKSNKYSVEDDGLVIRNDAEYASHVESKGYEVSCNPKGLLFTLKNNSRGRTGRNPSLR